jgi:NAD(P)-dependent dehydrogenase (short-subunit alcohol dehydrogenase family)
VDLFSLEGKTALVTGGSRGIGLMIARGLLDAGARVYLTSRKADACEEAAAALAAHGEAVALPADVGEPDEVDRLVAELADRGDLSILVNNAGTNWAAPIGEYPASAWDKVLRVNLTSAFTLTQACLPLLERGAAPADPARVINVGSIDGLRVPAFETYAYSASKAGLHHLTRVLAQQLAGRNLTVNAVAPGPFESKMMAATLEAFGDVIRAQCPLGRIGEPDDMAGVAVYLASRAGAYVTGQVIAVDGGLSTKA